jgi:hypothetical protein
VVTFVNPVMYHCIAQDGSEEIYTVTVTKAPEQTGNDFLSFTFANLIAPAEVYINQTGLAITLSVPFSTTLTSLTAIFTTSPAATVSVSGIQQFSGVSTQNFTNPILYTVTSESGVGKTYTVTVNKAPVQTGKQILSFDFLALMPAVSGTIDQVSKTVNLTVTQETPVTSLVASFTLSPAATVRVGATPQISGVTANNFINPLVYTVVSESGSLQDYLVTVNRVPYSSAKELISFSFTGLDPVAVGTINQDTKTVRVTVPFGTNVTSLIATYTHSPLSTVQVGPYLQTSGVSINDFSGEVWYDVYAQDGSVSRYTVIVSTNEMRKGFLSYSLSSTILPGGDVVHFTSYGLINETNHTILVNIPYTASKSSLVANFTLTANTLAYIGGVAQISGVTVNDFSGILTCQLQATDGSYVNYDIIVAHNPLEIKKQLVSFSFNGITPNVGCIIDEVTRKISAVLPFGTNLSSLVASFETTSMLTRVKIGGVRQSSGITVNNFSNPLIYSCIAEDGTTLDYTVTALALPASSSNQITDFRFNGLSAPAIGTIDEVAGTILVTIPWAASPVNLIATFTQSPISVVRIGSVVQTSGVTPNNFSSPVFYQVTAQDGSVKSYLVTVVKTPASSENSILSFRFSIPSYSDIIGTINEGERTIHLVVPFSQTVTGLVATFASSPYSSVFVGTTQQVSGVTVNSFTGPLLYTCRSENGLTATYAVTVSHAPVETANTISTFRFNETNPDAIGIIDQNNFSITIHLPVSQSVNGLVATFTLSPMARAYIGGVLQTSGITANNFSSTVTYVVVAENGSSRNYYVNIVRDPVRTDHLLESFSFLNLFPPVHGIVDQVTHQVSVNVPFSTNLNGMVASFTNSYLSTVRVSGVMQTSGVTSNNFTTSLVYSVFAEDGGVQNYVVNVARNPISSAKQILDYRFLGLAADAVGVIQEEDGLIIVTIPWSANLNNLVASFVTSPTATVKVGSALQESGVTSHSFSSPVLYTVTAENGSTKHYSVIVNRAAAATGNTILSFNFENQFEPDIVGIINYPEKTIQLVVPFTTDVSGLVPTFICSRSASLLFGATVQISGVTPNNFTNPLTYLCRAEDGSTEIYTVTVTRAVASDAKQILDYRFLLADETVVGVVDQAAKTVRVTVPFGADITFLVAHFTLSGLARAEVDGIVQVSGETPHNFSVPLMYRIVAEDQSAVLYSVIVSFDQNSEKRLYTFGFNGLIPPVSGVIDENAKTVQVFVPFSTSRTNLVASFTQSINALVLIGTTVQVSGVTANNFTSPKAYTVKAQDNSTQVYTVSVLNSPPSGEALITDFRFDGLPSPAIGVINHVAGTIVVTVSFGQDVRSLVPTFTTSPYSRVLVGTTVQQSGITAHDFTNPIVYVCEAEDGSTEVYTVTVVHAPASNLKDILTFGFVGLAAPTSGVIDPVGRTITVLVPGETDITSLRAAFTLSPLAIAKVGGASQISGVTTNDFSLPVRYTIVAEDNSEAVYLVTVVVGSYVDKKILTFGFSGLGVPAEGVIDEDAGTILVFVPFSTNRSGLVAEFTSSAKSTVYVGSAQQISGVTVNDFNAVRTYTVRAEDNSTRDYQVTVLKSPARTENLILTFNFNELDPAIVGVIDQSAKTIRANVPFGTAVNALVPTFTNSLFSAVSVAGVEQISGTMAHDFRNPVVFRCTSEGGLINEYVVSVIIAQASSEKEITYFAFEELVPVCQGEISQFEQAITIEVPAGTAVTALKASFISSPGATVYIVGKGIQTSGSSVVDFSLPVVYQVFAEDGTSTEYTVTVHVVPDLVLPLVLNPSQVLTNASGEFAVMQSSKSSGKVYLIRNDAPQTSVGDLDYSVLLGWGRQAAVSQAYTEIRISTYTLEQGVYHTYAVDGAGNKSLKGVNTITVVDVLAPTVFMLTQTVSNAPSRFVSVRSSDPDGYVYLILEGMPHGTKQQLDAAVGMRKGQKAVVTVAGVDIPVSTFLLLPGNYRAVAVDNNGNVSDLSTSVATLTEASSQKAVLSFSFNDLTPPSVGQIIGSDIFINVPVGTPLNALVAYFSLSPQATAFVGLVEQISGITPNNFTRKVIYTVEAEDGSLAEFSVTVGFGTGIDPLSWLNNIKAYPNPFSNRLTLEMTVPADRIRIADVLGRVVADLTEPGSTLVEINTNGWTAGVYFVRYYLDGKYVGIRKVMKE